MQSLKDTILYLKSHSPFYKRWLQEQKINSREINTIADLKKLKTVTKQEFAENNFDFLCCPKHKIADYCTTSGTTGKAVTVALTESDIQRLAQNEVHTFTLANLTEHDVCMLMLTLDRQFMAGITYYEGLRKLGVPVVRSGSVSPFTQLKNIIDFEPTVLVAVPSFLLKIIDAAIESNISLAALSVKKIICIGEPIRTENLLPNHLANRITSQWQVKLFSTYASSEMQTAFSECEVGKGNHLNPELLIAEILDEEGNEMPEGEVGELTITTLGVQGMPLLRYRTGDLVYAINEQCSCGRKEMRISPVLGRKSELLKYKGTTIFPAAIHNLLQSETSVIDYLIEAYQVEGRTEKLKINMVCAEAPENVRESITNKFKTYLRVTPEMAFCKQEDLINLRPKEARKVTKFIVR